MFAHWITLVPKIVLITLVAFIHKLMLYFVTQSTPNSIPILDNVRVEYRALKLTTYKELIILPDKSALLNTNPDHQALRQAALVWSNPRVDIVNGLGHFVHDKKFIRGYLNNDLSTPNPTPAPASVPISVAFGLVSAIKYGIYPLPNTVSKYLEAVDELMLVDMKIDTSTSTELRLTSSGFDAAYALSLLYSAHYLSGGYKYLKKANEILFNKGYAALLLAPITWTTEAHRDSFKDNSAIIALWTAYQTCPNKAIRLLLKHAMKFTVSQSYAYANPFWSALAHDVDALPTKEIKRVLGVHFNTSLLKASKVRNVTYSNTLPSDYSTHSADEFMFDELHGKGTDVSLPAPAQYASLNGLCLGKSLAVLLNKDL